MFLSKTLSPDEKQGLKGNADKHIHDLSDELNVRISNYDQQIEDTKKIIPQVADLNLSLLDGNSELMDQALGKIRLYTEMKEHLQTIQSSPYFVRLDIQWKETGEKETIYISKHQLKDQNIFSWVSPISTLRYAEIGEAKYERLKGGEKIAQLERKDTFIITGGEVVFMTYNDSEHERQVVFQKHMDERREFLLPEIVAELDKLQDQIIRSDPQGSFLISGPAGSGKTTLALHRVAYLVLTPEFKDFFDPERIIVFVADDSAIKYFSNLLPELGINGVRITTFMEWATMIANSRYRASKVPKRFKPLDIDAAVEFISKNNPKAKVHPRLILDEYRKLKQEMIMPIQISEGNHNGIYPALSDLYTAALDLTNPLHSGLVRYLNFQKDNKFLDEVDLTIILMSLENPVSPFVHIVVDEVQNWLPEQLKTVKSLAHFGQKSITFIGDIRQKTKAFSINSWEEIDSEFTENGPKSIELLKVYRNTKQILEYLKERGYDVTIQSNARDGKPVEIIELNERSQEERIKKISELAIKLHEQVPGVQIGVVSKYKSSLEGLLNLNYDDLNIHVLTIEEAQGLEFHSVIIIDPQDLDESKGHFQEELGYVSAEEFTAQNKHLFYVAATRAQEELYIVH